MREIVLDKASPGNEDGDYETVQFKVCSFKEGEFQIQFCFSLGWKDNQKKAISDSWLS